MLAMLAGNRPTLKLSRTSTMTVTQRRTISMLYSIASPKIQSSVFLEGAFSCMIRAIAELRSKNLWSGFIFRSIVLFDQASFKGRTSPFGGPLFPKSGASTHGSGRELSSLARKRNCSREFRLQGGPVHTTQDQLFTTITDEEQRSTNGG